MPGSSVPSPVGLEGPSHAHAKRARRPAGRIARGLGLGLALLALAGVLPSVALAGDGTSFEVTTTAAVVGSTVSGTLIVDNLESQPLTISNLTASIEVRFDEGVPIPALPAGSSAGWYRVAQIALPAPASVPAASSQSFPFVLDPCSATVPNYRSAKDMRAFGAVTAGRVRDAYSNTFALPAACPACGNAVLEAGEQCDAGPNGGSCCTSSCQFRAAGTTCNDGNACTQADACQAGVCLGGAPVVCTAQDACRSVGVCNPTTGVCSQPAKANGTACDDQNACTTTDTCQSGTCRGGNPVVCPASGPCMNARCEPASGACVSAPKPDGTACSDASACTTGDQCLGGTCTSGAPLACNDAMSCTTDRCDDALGCTFTPGTTCESCDAAQCADCSGRCATAETDCVTGCWAGFSACLDGCTSTYCAPFCQVDLGRCLESCPTVAACQSGCEAGNGCGSGCSGVEASQGASPQVPSFTRWGLASLATFLSLAGTLALLAEGRRGA